MELPPGAKLITSLVGDSSGDEVGVGGGGGGAKVVEDGLLAVVEVWGGRGVW
jgi:hypothetical protein